ncbi:hypothetical protein [Chondromyces crocatus]|uniref:DUF4398 domain-containing protein n=1 Tax=Chondromyces crocatus TaxID=52 RepID=A0A0K1EAV0_CHOCO|nr:hypothetical protein [Chondromyces crocatus]AKT38011.1 uncharacterized protein CMC5_021520 [Chondromyces crocatus]
MLFRVLFRVLCSPWFASVALGATLIFVPAEGQAHGGDERPLTHVPPAPRGSDGAKAEQVLQEIGRQPAEVQRMVAEPVEQARRALVRAQGTLDAHDPAHAHKLYGVSLEWAETARALLRAADTEKKTQETAKKAREVAAQLERARTLLAETQARLARAEAELSRVEAEGREAARAAAAAEEARVAGGRKGATPPSAGGGGKGSSTSKGGGQVSGSSATKKGGK